MEMCSRLPVLFVSHGAGPAGLLNLSGSMFSSLDKSSPSAAFMRDLKSHVPGTIKNILVVSAHWEERQFTVSYHDRGTKLYYDYGGFPKESYAPYLTYPVPTDLELSETVIGLLKSANIPVEKSDRGFDHGMFIPLKQAFSEATIPVVQISLKSNLSIRDHIKLGEILAPLRDQGTLIVCSGQITHNTHSGINPGGRVDPRAVATMDWIRVKLEGTTASNYQETKNAFLNIHEECPHFDWNHPRTEHFVPMYVAVGAVGPQNPDINIRSIYKEVVVGALGVEHYLFN